MDNKSPKDESTWRHAKWIDSMDNKSTTSLQEQVWLTKAMGEATWDWTAERAENTVTGTIQDAATGAKAVKSAVVVRHDVYNSRPALIQRVREMKAYGGMQSANGAARGMLEAVVDEFVRLEGATKAAETQLQQIEV